MNNSIFGFNITRVGKGKETTLQLSGDEQQLRLLLQFQLGMLTNNRIPGLATLKVKQRDLQVTLVYPIGGLISLAEYLSARPIALAGLGELLERMVQPVTECKNYFLHERCFVIDPDYIFLNPSSLRTSLIYVPVSFPQGVDPGYQKTVETVGGKLGVKKKAYFESLEGATGLEKLLDFARLLGSEGFNQTVMVEPADKVLCIRPNGTLAGMKPIVVVEDQ